MKLLLDTHIWLWHELEPERLEARTARVLSDPRHELWVSPVSAWELVLLVEGKRLELDREVPAWVEMSLAGERYRQAPLTMAVAMTAARVRLEHRDPADRLLAATAAHYDMKLVTADRRLLAGHGFALFR